MTNTVEVKAYDLVPGNVIVWPGTLWRQTVSTVESVPAARNRRVYVVTFAENEPTAAPARFSQDDVFQVERVN